MTNPLQTIPVEILRLPHGEGLQLPAYATDGAAGLDLLAAVPETIQLAPGARMLVPTGVSVAIPPGYEIQIRPRSGLALKNGIMVVNSPGTIDSDYRGEIGVILLNTGERPYSIDRGSRIAQAVLAPVTRLEWQEVSVLSETNRGAGGFGSTGTA